MPLPLIRRWAGAFVLGLLTLFGACALANNEESEARMRRDVTYLASDECEGRGPGTKGIDLAAEYIADQFKKAGLKPGGPGGSYFQPFTIPTGASKLEGKGGLRLTGPREQQIELQPGVHFEVTGGSGGGTVTGPLVFAGFGVTAPALNYDDYKDLDVKGKVVVVIRRVPRWDSKDAPFGGSDSEKQRLAALLNKFFTAEANRASAVLLVNDASDDPTGDKLQPFSSISGFGGGVSIPVLHVRRSVLDAVLLSSLGSGLRE